MRRLGVNRDDFVATTRRVSARELSRSGQIPRSCGIGHGRGARAYSSSRSDDVAELQICEVDSWILVEVGAGPNGTDAIVNPDVIAYRSTVTSFGNVDGIVEVRGRERDRPMGRRDRLVPSA